jgi:hypothetical protein
VSSPPPTEALAAVAHELRAGLRPLLQTLAGSPPRPVRLTQGIGLDKSLASRLVQSVRAEGDEAFLHAVPSPTGLRMLIERARGHADASLLSDVEAAVRRFEALLDRLPGGRQALDARIGETSSPVREKREQIARQASFKAVSFLFGHYCQTLTTALFLLPSATRGKVDAIEVHRRIGLQRLSSAAALPLLSVGTGTRSGPLMVPLGSDMPLDDPTAFLLPGSAPDLDVVHEGSTTTFVLRPGASLPERLSTGWRVLRVEDLTPAQAWLTVRNYMLHLPCQLLVRDIYLAPGLWPDARPLVGFCIPGPSGTPAVEIEPGQPHLRRLNLTARIEQLPDGPAGLEMREVTDQRATLEAALARAEAGGIAWRGWRCRMAYPVPLVEMQLALRFGAR